MKALILVIMVAMMSCEMANSTPINLPSSSEVTQISVYPVRSDDSYNGIFQANRATPDDTLALLKISDQEDINKILAKLALGSASTKTTSGPDRAKIERMTVFFNNDKVVMILWHDDTNAAILRPPIDPRNATIPVAIDKDTAAVLDSLLIPR